jgi:protein-S-isoprenylcysteine O-methyltransferase Ste14
MPEIDGMEEKNGEHPYGDAGQLILLGLFLLVWVGDSFFLRLSTFPADYLPRSIRLTFLVFCLAIAAGLFKSGHVVISHGRRPSGLVSTGAFKYVRHPLYLGCILFYLGLAFCTFSLFSLVLWVAIFIFYNYIASYEEKLLEARFGERYRIYQEHTGKWLPRIPGMRKDQDAVF